MTQPSYSNLLKQTCVALILTLVAINGASQVYIEKQTRHRFAQLNFGLSGQSAIGGQAKFLDSRGEIRSTQLTHGITPGFVIGGTHFWGHADFYINIPVFKPTIKTDNQEITALRGVETVFKYYPFRIEHKKIRPFVGTAITPLYYRQNNNNLPNSKGPEMAITRFPLHFGTTFNSGSHLIELGAAWNYDNEHDYFISPNQNQTIATPPLFLTLSYRLMLETTLSAEKNWESGKTKEVTQILSEQGKLNGFYAGIGISSAFWLQQADYNKKERPYLNLYPTSIMPDFSVGYFFHRPDVNLAVAYRGFGTTAEAYGAEQKLTRNSLLFEATKSLFDYHGFVPFIGPALGFERLSFVESFEGQPTHNTQDDQFGYGITFGWDIRPNSLQMFILRTNLRWYPTLALNVSPDTNVSFNNLEFNFIQLIIYPNRIFGN